MLITNTPSHWESLVSAIGNTLSLLPPHLKATNVLTILKDAKRQSDGSPGFLHKILYKALNEAASDARSVRVANDAQELCICSTIGAALESILMISQGGDPAEWLKAMQANAKCFQNR